MIHMHCFELCFTKSRGFAGVRLWLGDYRYPSSRADRKEFISETRFRHPGLPETGKAVGCEKGREVGPDFGP